LNTLSRRDSEAGEPHNKQPKHTEKKRNFGEELTPKTEPNKDKPFLDEKYRFT